MKVFLKVACVSMATVMLSAPALAEPVDDFIERLNLWLEPAGASIEVASVLKSKAGQPRMALVLKSPNGEIPLGREVTFNGVETWDGDLLFAEAITISGFDHTSDRVQAEADTITLGWVTLPPPGTDNPFLLSQMLGAFNIANLKITDDGDSFEVDEIDYAMGVEPEYGSPDPTTMAVAATVTGLLINDRLYDTLSMDDLPFGRQFIVDQKLDMYLPVHWDLENGLVTISDASVNLPSLGSFNTGFQIGGLTLPILTEVVGFGTAAATGAEADPAAQQALGIKLLAQTTFHAASVSLTDAGMVQAFLRFGAEQMGGTEAEAKATIADFLDDTLTQMPLLDARVEEIITGVMGFVEQGGTFGLDAFPETPSSFIELVALGQAPGTLLDKIAFEAVHIPPDADAASTAQPATETATTEAAAPAADPFAATGTPEAFLERLSDYVGKIGGTLDYGSVNQADGAIDGFSINPPAGSALELHDVKLGPVMLYPGDLLQSRLSGSGFERSEAGTTVKVGSVVVDSLLPDPQADVPLLLAIQGLQSLELKDVVIDSGGRLAIDRVLVEVLGSRTPNPPVLGLRLRFEGVDVTDELVNAFGDTPLMLLGGNKLDLSASADWNLETGDISFQGLTLEGEDFGKIDISAFLTGLKAPLLEEAIGLLAPSGAPRTQEQDAAMQAFSLKLMSQLALKSVFLNVTDDGFLDDIAELVELNTGVASDKALQIIVNQYVGLADDFARPDLAENLKISLQALVDQGGTVSANAMPQQPLNLLVIASLSNSPKLLIEQLGVGIGYLP